MHIYRVDFYVRDEHVGSEVVQAWTRHEAFISLLESKTYLNATDKAKDSEVTIEWDATQLASELEIQ